MNSEMISDWNETTLGECADWSSGGTPNTAIAAYWDGDIPWITASSLHNFYLRDSERRITELGLQNGSRLMPEDTIIFVVRGMSLKTEFRVGVAMRPMAFGQDCKAIVAKNGINPFFLANALRAKASDILGLVDEASHGTGRLQTSALQQLRIVIPPLPEQRAIAQILGALDDKIELNRRMNATLEAMARALFQSWFVDFDPVRAKERGEQPAGLAPEIAALFPDALVETELGAAPVGWEVTSLADQITATKGLSYKGQHLCEPGEGLPMHNLNSVYEGGGYKNEGLKWYNGEYRPTHLLKPGDVIVTNTEQGFDRLLIGYAAIVPERYGLQGLFSHHLFRIQRKTASYLPEWFIHLLLRTQRFHDLVAGHANGTTVNMLPLDGLQKPQLILPSIEIVECFGRLFTPIQRRLEHIHDENTSLAILRDALLPRLISGQLRVADAERIAGRSL